MLLIRIGPGARHVVRHHLIHLRLGAASGPGGGHLEDRAWAGRGGVIERERE
jgi:hypothetical protein